MKASSRISDYTLFQSNLQHTVLIHRDFQRRFNPLTDPFALGSVFPHQVLETIQVSRTAQYARTNFNVAIRGWLDSYCQISRTMTVVAFWSVDESGKQILQPKFPRVIPPALIMGCRQIGCDSAVSSECFLAELNAFTPGIASNFGPS